VQGNVPSIISHELHQLACALSDSWELVHSTEDLVLCREELTEAVRRIRGTANQLAAAMRNTQQCIKRGAGGRELKGVQRAFEKALSRYELFNKKTPADDSPA
jgi:hypothetical protein